VDEIDISAKVRALFGNIDFLDFEKIRFME
jgi:hypothetical protein